MQEVRTRKAEWRSGMGGAVSVELTETETEQRLKEGKCFARH